MLTNCFYNLEKDWFERFPRKEIKENFGIRKAQNQTSWKGATFKSEQLRELVYPLEIISVLLFHT